ncbi:MAG: aspartyl protease family protein [Hyphomonadaceae bacterium]
MAFVFAAFGGQARAECVPVEELSAAPPAEVAQGGTSTDARGRVVAPVMINGQGPFRFIVDTGANRSVISQSLADSLGLAPIGTGEVHAIQGVTVAPLVELESFQYRNLALPTGPLPLLQGRVLAGEQGLLGADSMSGRRMRLDFERRCLEIVPARRARRLQGWEMVRGELHFGHLVVLEGRVGETRVNVFLDTGSDSTLANFALRDALRRQITYDQAALDYARLYNAGEPIVLDSAVVLPRLRIGPLNANNVLAYVGDFHIFRLAGLNDEPTLLIGMDVLRRARAIAIDYDRATVHFRLRGVRPMISMRPA